MLQSCLLSYLARVQGSDVLSLVRRKLTVFCLELVVVLVEIALSFRKIFVNQSIGTVLVTDIENCFLVILAIVLVMLALIVSRSCQRIVVKTRRRLIASKEAEALGSALRLPRLRSPELA